MVPLLAMTQMLKTRDQLAFLVGLLAARSWYHIVSRGAPGSGGGVGGTPGMKGPRAHAAPAHALSVLGWGWGGLFTVSSLYFLLCLHMSATVNYTCGDTMPQGAEGGPKWSVLKRDESRSGGKTDGRPSLEE